MTEQLIKLTPSGTDIKPQLYASEPLDGISAVEELIFREKVDVLYDPKVCARRHRIEWPTSDALIRDTICQDSQLVTGSAKIVLDSEMSRCGPRSDYVPDIAVFDQLYAWSLDWQGMLRNLYWRCRRQSAIWDVFKLLVARGLLHPRCLTVPMDTDANSVVSRIVNSLVFCLSFPSQNDDFIIGGKIPLQSACLYEDNHWYTLSSLSFLPFSI